MNFNKFLKSLFGDKSSRDMKLIQPLVEKIKAASPEIEQLDNDALRAKTKEIQQRIQSSAQEQKAQIAAIKETLYDMGATYAAMSGSGSTVYGLFTRRQDSLEEVFPDCFTYQSLLR